MGYLSNMPKPILTTVRRSKLPALPGLRRESATRPVVSALTALSLLLPTLTSAQNSLPELGDSSGVLVTGQAEKKLGMEDRKSVV